MPKEHKYPASVLDWTEADLERWLLDVWKNQRRKKLEAEKAQQPKEEE